MAKRLYGQVNVPIEFAFTAQRKYNDIFNEIEIDVVFTDTAGQEWKVPAFWSGDNDFRVRFAAPKEGKYTFRSVCTNAEDAGVNGQTGELEVRPYEGDNSLYQHGGFKVSENKRYFKHADGTPFFWLADTWWMGFCDRLEWPGEFQMLTQDRVEKGYSVIHIVGGLYPDMPAFDERGTNEAGFPWTEDWSRINPEYYDMADLRIEWLVKSGLAPCIVAAWGYYLPWTGIEVMKKHWRNLIARYGAYPVFWCLAGEVMMQYYLSDDPEGDKTRQREGWTEIAKYIRETDPYHRLMTAHPAHALTGRGQIEDPSLIDFDWLQTGHGDRGSIPDTVKGITGAYDAEPRMPVINSEVCYEGIGEMCRQEVQRFMFWSCLLSGACGHSYGANGIWQLNGQKKPYGPSPHGMAWGNVSWEEAYKLPGSKQLGMAKKFLERYEWWRFESHPEWVDPHWTDENYSAPFAAGIPGEVRVIFLPSFYPQAVVKDVEKDVPYRAFLWNPAYGEEIDFGDVKVEDDGSYLMPIQRQPFAALPVYQDWILVLERKR